MVASIVISLLNSRVKIAVRSVAVALLYLPAMCRADTAILYPELRAPYDKIFSTISSGIEQELKAQNSGPVRYFKVSRNPDIEDLQNWLNKYPFEGITALGNRSIKALQQVDSTLPTVVLGAIINHPKDSQYNGISMVPSPQLLFQQAQSLAPKIKNIHLIYVEKKQDWLVNLAQQAAVQLDLKLVTVATENRRQAALAYRQLLTDFHKKDNNENIIWLAQNGMRLDKALLNEVLQYAWDDSIIVISSNLADVKRGALTALYPDNKIMGVRLAKLLLEELKAPSSSASILPSTSLLRAVNLRTAEHLGIHLDHSQIRQQDLIYPATYRAENR